MLKESIVRSLCEVLGRTDGGLTNKEIDHLLAEARIEDPTPAASPGTYVMIAKRDRLFHALSARQRRDSCGNAILAFVSKSLAPVRFHSSPTEFEALRLEINVPLAFAGYYVNEAGKLRLKPQAETLSEARERGMRLEVGDLVRCAEATDGDPLREVFRVAGQHRGVLDQGGRDGLGGDAVGSLASGDEVQEAVEAGLGGGVVRADDPTRERRHG